MFPIHVMNPPKSTRKKSRKAPSAKQRANWARFAAMARRRAKAGKSTTTTRRPKRQATSERKATTVSKSHKKRKSYTKVKRKGGGHKHRSRGFFRLPGGDIGGTVLLSIGATAGMIGVTKGVDQLPAKWFMKDDGTVNGNLRIMAKGGVSILAYAVLRLLAKLTRMPVVKRFATGVLVGGLSAVTYDTAVKLVPKLAPSMHGWDDEGMGEFEMNTVPQLNGYIRPVDSSMAGLIRTHPNAAAA